MSLFPKRGSRLALGIFFHLCSTSLEPSRDRDDSLKQYLVLEREEVGGSDLTEMLKCVWLPSSHYKKVKYSVNNGARHHPILMGSIETSSSLSYLILSSLNKSMVRLKPLKNKQESVKRAKNMPPTRANATNQSPMSNTYWLPLLHSSIIQHETNSAI